MKKNALKTVALIGALGALLFIAYLMQGREDKGVKLFNFDREELISITLNKARIALKEGGPFLPSIDHPADPKKVDSLIDKLKGLRIVKEIDSDKKESFFSHQNLLIDLKTNKGRQKTHIGDVSEVTGNFYGEGKNAKDEERIFILSDTSLYEGFYRDELELKLRKYWELKKLLNSEPIELADKRLLGPESVARAQKVRFDPKVNRWFEIDLSKKEIRPGAPKGLKEKIDPKELKRLLLSLRFESFVDRKNFVIEDLLSVLELEGKDIKLKAQLFGKLDGKNGLFATLSSRPNRIFLMEEKGREAFFLSAQHFYDKRPQIDIKQDLEGLKFALGPRPGEMKTFVLEDEESFEVRGPKGPPSKSAQQRFYLIFNALFASNGLEQANRARGLGLKELEEALSNLKSPVYLEFLGKTFVFALKGDELYLWDLEERLQFVYRIGSAFKSFSAEQFFALEEQEG